MLDLFGTDFLERNWLAPDVTPNKEVWAFVAVLIVANFAALQRRLLSDFFLTMLAIFPLVPMLALFSHRGAAPEYVAMCVFCYILIWVLIKIPAFEEKNKFAGIFHEDNFTKLSIFIISTAIIISIFTGNLDYVNFDFSEVYLYRYDAEETRWAIVSYAIPNSIGLFLPLSIAILLKNNRYYLVAIMFILNLFLFGLTSHKSYFFTPIFVLLFFFILRYGQKWSYIITAFSLVILSATLLYKLTGAYEIFPTLTVRRMFFVPAYANYLYYDFFSTSPQMFWADSKLSFGLVQNPYGVTAPRIILNYYNFGSMTFQFAGNGNSGFMGAGYGHAGLLGMMFYSAIIAGLLLVGNVIAEKIGFITACAGLTHLFISVLFCSTDTLSSFLSYGAFMMIVFAIIFKKSENPV